MNTIRAIFARIHWTRRDKVAAAAFGAFLALALVVAFCSAIGQAMGGGTSTGASTGAAALAASHATATHAPARATATPAPTDTPAPPAPTTTPLPTITPLPTVDPAILDQQTAQHLADTNCNFTANSQTATYDAGSGKVTVKVVVGTQWDVSAAQTTVEEVVFECFKGFYTSSHAGFVQDVYVEVDGPVTDAYGNNSTGLYGDAELSRATAQPFNWDNLYSQGAWDAYIYDSQWVRSN